MLVRDERFSLGDNIFINSQESSHFSSDESIETTFDETDAAVWVATILEIRAKDPSTVYSRIEWFFRPNDLPNGRLSYHGTNEIIKSARQDIIDVQAVAGRANVVHWNEDDDTQDANGIDGLYWRQTFDHVTSKLSVFTSTYHTHELENKIALRMQRALQSRYHHVLVQ